MDGDDDGQPRPPKHKLSVARAPRGSSPTTLPDNGLDASHRDDKKRKRDQVVDSDDNTSSDDNGDGEPPFAAPASPRLELMSPLATQSR